MRLLADNKPKESGVYYAGNFNKRNNRLEFELVRFDEDSYEVFIIETKESGYILSDWTYWSDKVS